VYSRTFGLEKLLVKDKPEGVSLDLNELFQKQGSKISLGLNPMKRSLEVLGWDLCPTFLIGGTNGKGTTTTALWLYLSSFIEKVGLYSSPHIKDFAERIRLSHKTLSTIELSKILNELQIPFYEDLSFFEVTTLLAYHVFLSYGASYQVLEVGLGGRLDATNTVPMPLLSCVTSIDLDHMEYLGQTHKAIAKEKLGIARVGRPLFWLEASETTEEKGLNPILEDLENKGVLVYRNGRDFYLSSKFLTLNIPRTPQLVWDFSSFAKEDRAFQNNLMGASAMFWWFLHQGVRAFDKKVLFQKGFEKITRELGAALPGRSQELTIKGQHFYLDVAHNPSAIENLLEKLSCHKKKPKYIFCGFLKDKDYKAMIRTLQKLSVPIYGFALRSPRSASALDLEEILGPNFVFSSFDLLAEKCLPEIKTTLEEPILVCGSFVAVEQCLKYRDAKGSLPQR
jgi:dihydrofolate synthase/folylpolyglutamate synthase